MSYTVTRRTREIGVRVAAGAQRQKVLWLVLRETLALALFGIAIGISSACAATRLIATMLFGLSPSDLPTWPPSPCSFSSSRFLPVISQPAAPPPSIQSLPSGRNESG